jgi:diguanylate cyclase (GGDEF)-like protein/putative nucleotidyltransferase with HDIG domain
MLNRMEPQKTDDKTQRRPFFSFDEPLQAVEGEESTVEKYSRLKRATLTSAGVRAFALAVICGFFVFASKEMLIIWKMISLVLHNPSRSWAEVGDALGSMDIAQAIVVRLNDPSYLLSVALVLLVCMFFGMWTASRQLKLLDYQIKLELGNKRFHEMSLRDDLTGLYNQRALKEQLDVELERGRRHGRCVTLLMLDVDFYKSINDRYGHIFGDRVLAELAVIVKTSLRKVDVVARYGGDEFVIILPETDEQAAHIVCRRVLTSVEEHEFALEDIRAHVTVSIGGATCSADESVDKSELMRRADEALYLSKQGGKNRVTFWRPNALSPLEPQTHQGMKKLGELQRKIYALSKEAREASVESIYALAAALEAKDGYTQRHSIAVMSVATGIARAMLLVEEEVEQVRNAALLHDIGKIGIGEEILLKEGPLSEDEKAIIRQHPIIGANILAPIRYLRELVPMVRHHHERYDGLGYPSGLKGEEIPLGARILAVADSYCAMTADRPYSLAKTREEANAEMLGRAGTQFDPKVVEALTQNVLVSLAE